jgi:hypothetical protein
MTEADVGAWLSAVKLYESQLDNLFEAMPDWQARFRAFARKSLS